MSDGDEDNCRNEKGKDPNQSSLFGSKTPAHQVKDQGSMVKNWKRIIRHELSNSDHADRVSFIRAYSIGYGVQVIPSVFRLVMVKVIGFTRHPSDRKFLLLLKTLTVETLKLIIKGLRPTGLGMASGIAMGGARLLERVVRSQVEALVRLIRVVLITPRFISQRLFGRFKTNNNQDHQLFYHELSDTERLAVSLLSTFSAASLSSLVAIMILQSKHTHALKAQDPLHPTMTPYPTLLDLDDSQRSKRPIFIGRYRQSPTLDFTLFFTVRALDTLCRSIYDNFSPDWLSFLSKCSDTLLFQISCWRIMWCWFYKPERLPMSYVKWITSLAEMDQRLLKVIRLARQGRFEYGKPAESDKIQNLSRSIATHMGRLPEESDPQFISKLSCAIIHGRLGNSESCTLNVIRRFFKAWKTSLGIYFPVFTVPVLLFQRKQLINEPAKTMIRVLINSSRSAGFLSSFVGLTWGGVCLGRSEMIQNLLNKLIALSSFAASTRPKKFITATVLDSVVAPQLGSLLAGLSILIENKKRRGEMALYVATRALCATVDELLPRWLRVRIKANRWVSIWTERITFSISIGIIISAIVHQPDYVRGIVKGILEYAVGPDWPKYYKRPKPSANDRSPSQSPRTVMNEQLIQN